MLTNKPNSKILMVPFNSPEPYYTIIPSIDSFQCPPLDDSLPPLNSNLYYTNKSNVNSSPLQNDTMTPSLIHTPHSPSQYHTLNEISLANQFMDEPLSNNNHTKLDILAYCSSFKSYSPCSPPDSFEFDSVTPTQNQHSNVDLFYQCLVNKLELCKSKYEAGSLNSKISYDSSTTPSHTGRNSSTMAQTYQQDRIDKSGNISPLPLSDGSGRVLHFSRDPENRTFTCLEDNCGKVFYSVFNLKSHATTHSETRAFSCDQCGNAFRRKQDLNRHLLVHTQIKPFACPSCKRRFSRKDAQRRHSARKKCVILSTSLGTSEATMLKSKEISS
ncbi:hypothetical protein K502DRAFT_324302 [Neoconidiobolus thromboides FSU 785]|nr:hypothetical protein K502DRAFT_324302 [Neoconidiobolus thromboides FSU 785]